LKLTPQERDDLGFACALAKQRLLEPIQASDENLKDKQVLVIGLDLLAGVLAALKNNELRKAAMASAGLKPAA
jgi:hypothetical protein